MAEKDVKEFTVPELKDELKDLGAPTDGNKEELVERLQAADPDYHGEGTKGIRGSEPQYAYPGE